LALFPSLKIQRILEHRKSEIFDSFDFGYYRIFESIIYLSPKTFYTDTEAVKMLVEERGEFQAHLIPGVLYIVASIVLILIIIILK